MALALPAAGEDPVYEQIVELLENGKFEAATEQIALLEQAQPKHAELSALRQQAAVGVARNLQRQDGYGAALDYLESRLEGRTIVQAYSETSVWAGAEQRGLETMRRLPKALRHQCAREELNLYWALHDFVGMEQRAREVEWPEWIEFARNQGALRERFDGRTRRAWWVAGVGAALLAGGCLLLDRMARRRAAAA
jgi:hypothetical protein